MVFDTIKAAIESRADSKRSRDLERFSLSDEDIQKMTEDLVRMFSGQFGAQRNQLTDQFAANGGPLAAQAAAMRGLAMNQNQALVSGVNDLQKTAAFSRIDAEKFIENLNFQQLLRKDQKDRDRNNFIAGIFGKGGQAAGEFFGSKGG